MKIPVTEILDRCREMAFAGKDYLDVKKYVNSLKIEQEAANTILIKADEFLVTYQRYQQFHIRSMIFMMAGVLLILVGILANFLSTKDTIGYYTFTFVPIIIGARILLTGYKNFRLSPEDMQEEGVVKKGKFDRYVN